MEEAMPLAPRAVDERDPLTIISRLHRDWEPLWGRPGFAALMARMGVGELPRDRRRG
jgi:hypothetical protein